jgi:hypothetical protein
MESNKKTWLVLGGVGAVVIALAAGGGGPDNSQPPSEAGAKKPDAPAQLSAEATDIIVAYEANEAAAQAKYGDRSLQVTGIVKAIDLDFSDKPVVHLAASADAPKYLMANLTDEAQAKAASLSKGQKLTVTCSEVSEVISIPILGGCSF